MVALKYIYTMAIEFSIELAYQYNFIHNLEKSLLS